jgi:hypothetical protein
LIEGFIVVKLSDVRRADHYALSLQASPLQASFLQLGLAQAGEISTIQAPFFPAPLL